MQDQSVDHIVLDLEEEEIITGDQMHPLGPNINSRFVATVRPASYNIYQQQSWEERAFAVDSAGGLEGCLWPPRSYFCSFCRREFRSAQALGGHMNIHRRDRARLKDQSADKILEADEHPQVDQSLVFGISTDNPNPNSGLSSSLPLPRFAAESSTQDYLWSYKPTSSISTSCSPLDVHQVDHVKDSVFPATLYSLIPLQLMYKDQQESKLGKLESSPRGKAAISRRWGDHEEDNYNMNKRRRTSDSMPNLQMESPSSEYDHQNQFKDEVCKSNITVEELDLELRLGDARKLN